MAKIVKGNVGEWSELYVLLNLILDNNTNRDCSYVICRPGYPHNYKIEDDYLYVNNFQTNYNVAEIKNSIEIIKILIKKRNKGFIESKNSKIIKLLNIMHITSLKSPSKTKIDIVYKCEENDKIINNISIKSFINSFPTVMNTSGARALIIELKPKEKVRYYIRNNYKTKYKVREKIIDLKKHDVDLKPLKFSSNEFSDKLYNINEKLEDILKSMAINWILGEVDNIDENIKKTSKSLKITYSECYEIFKSFILSELGLIEKDSEITIVSINKKFKINNLNLKNNDINYKKIYKNLYFDMPSMNKHNYKTYPPGDIFSEDGNYLSYINFQIRIKKIG